MAKKFDELRQKMSPESRARAETNALAILKEMPLHELRQAQQMSQMDLANKLNVNQAAISKVEHRTDVYISTLRSYIQAMGGDLEVVAKFPYGEVKISNFSANPKTGLTIKIKKASGRKKTLPIAA